MEERDFGQTHMTWNEYAGDESPGELYPRPKHGITIGES
jgi:hypothetical protein